MTIDQLAYFASDPASSESIQHVGKTTIPYRDVAIGLVKDSGLLGTFPFPRIHEVSSFASIHMITSDTIVYDDPWIVPSESEIDSFGNAMPLSPYEHAYEDTSWIGGKGKVSSKPESFTKPTPTSL